MEKLLWLTADGIEIFIEQSTVHYIDRPDFWHNAFTLYAAYDPIPAKLQKHCYKKSSDVFVWIEIQPETLLKDKAKDDFNPSNYRYRLSKPCSPAHLFKQRLQIEYMLHSLFDGHVIGEGDHFYAVKRLKGETCFNINMDSLLSKQDGRETEQENYICFAARLGRVFKISNRQTTWKLAWVLTRAALANNHHIIHKLSTCLTPAKKGEDAPCLEDLLAEYIAKLRSVQVR